MTAEIRDLYGQLIDGMRGTRGQIRTGGDVAGGGIEGSPPTQKPLALYSGIITVGPNGTAEVSFDLPEFAGTARVMAVAWTATKLGRATTDVTIRDPIVMTTTLPRFLLTGDRGTLHLDLDNVEGPAGDYTVAVRLRGPIAVPGNASTVLRLAEKQRNTFAVAIQTTAAGTAEVDIDVTGPNGMTLTRHYALAGEARDADPGAPHRAHARQG